MSLFEPTELRGGLSLQNRIAMAPMTRARAGAGDIPSIHTADYYAQRATAGLVITEGTIVSPAGKGYSLTPGIYNESHVEAWSEVTRRVHEASPGARIFCQLWHVGRISHPDISGFEAIAPSALQPPAAKLWLQRPDGWQGAIGCGTPREMSHEDIRTSVEEFRASARMALEAGFDGVELHAANGYLIDQFMRASTNLRDDEYGGGVSNRLRFLREIVDAVADEVGPDRIGVRFSPIVDYGDTEDPQIEDTILQAAAWLDSQDVAYIHLIESENTDLLGDTLNGQQGESVASHFREQLRARFSGTIILVYRYDRERAEAVLASGLADVIAFGRPFIANPDLVDRLHRGVELAESDTSTWYGGGAEGFTDYPAADSVVLEAH